MKRMRRKIWTVALTIGMVLSLSMPVMADEVKPVDQTLESVNEADVAAEDTWAVLEGAEEAISTSEEDADTLTIKNEQTDVVEEAEPSPTEEVVVPTETPQIEETASENVEESGETEEEDMEDEEDTLLSTQEENVSDPNDGKARVEIEGKTYVAAQSGAGGAWRWDGKGTLYLSGFQTKQTITVYGDVHINVSGINTVHSIWQNPKNSKSTESGSLTIDGSGELRTNALDIDYGHKGIVAAGGIIIKNTTVSIRCGFEGISGFQSVSIINSDVLVHVGKGEPEGHIGPPYGLPMNNEIRIEKSNVKIELEAPGYLAWAKSITLVDSVIQEQGLGVYTFSGLQYICSGKKSKTEYSKDYPELATVVTIKKSTSVKNGFVKETVNGKSATRYYENGKMILGQKKIGNYWYMFHPTTGAMQTGFYNHTVQTNPKGGVKTCYYDGNGHMVYGQKKIGNYWYMFHPSSGAMIKGWYNHTAKTNPKGGAKTCYYDGSGHMVYGQKKIGNYWYMFHPSSGAMIKGWYNHTAKTNPKGGAKTCYYDASGHMVYGQKKIGNYWYMFHPSSGAMIKGWYNHTAKTNPKGGTKTCYYDKNGRMLYGWQTIGGKRYYFDPKSGALKK